MQYFFLLGKLDDQRWINEPDLRMLPADQCFYTDAGLLTVYLRLIYQKQFFFLNRIHQICCQDTCYMPEIILTFRQIRDCNVFLFPLHLLYQTFHIPEHTPLILLFIQTDKRLIDQNTDRQTDKLQNHACPGTGCLIAAQEDRRCPVYLPDHMRNQSEINGCICDQEIRNRYEQKRNKEDWIQNHRNTKKRNLTYIKQYTRCCHARHLTDSFFLCKQ